MTKFKFLSVLILTSIFAFSGCSNNSDQEVAKNWNDVVAKAKNKTITFYGWGGNPETNKFIDGYIAPILEDKYDIKVKRVNMLPPEYLDIIKTEKDANSKGSIDVVWINGNNFFVAKEQGLLMKDIDTKLPNYEKYIDTKDSSLMNDFQVPIDGQSIPFGRAQFIMMSNEKAKDVKDTKTLLEYAKNNKGRFTYPDPTVDFTGNAFIKNTIIDVIGEEKYNSINKNMSKDEILEIIKPAFDYLNQLEQYTWRSGKTYPQNITLLDNMYADGEVDFAMSYSPFHAASRVKSKEWASDTKTFILGEKSLGNTHYLSIATNSANKEASLVFINEVISVAAQLNKYNPNGWGDFPVFSINKLSDEDKSAFKAVEMPSSVLGYESFDGNSTGELHASIDPIIAELWKTNVLEK